MQPTPPQQRPSPRFAASSSPRTRKNADSPFANHVMGYNGYVPGGFAAVGTNVRTWLARKSRERNGGGGDSASGGGRVLESTGSSLSSASTRNGGDGVGGGGGDVTGQVDGLQHPICGYTGHVPGLQHCSKSLLGWSYREAVKQCWNEAAPLNAHSRSQHRNTPSSTTTTTPFSNSANPAFQQTNQSLLQPGLSVPPHSIRGWKAFQTTSRGDYPDHYKGGAVVGADANHSPDRLFATRASNNSNNTTTFNTNTNNGGVVFDATTSSSTFSVGGGGGVGGGVTTRPLSAKRGGSGGGGGVVWIEEESMLPRRTAVDVLALVRSKIRSRVGSTGEIRNAFRHFTSSNSNSINMDKWCNGLFLYGMNHFLRLSEAKAGFVLADQNQDSLLDFGEFVTTVMGRISQGSVSENTGFLTERRIAKNTHGVRL